MIGTISKKIIIVLLFIFIFNFLFSNLGNNIVFAAEDHIGAEISDEEMEKEGGGKFFLPIQDLILFLADALLELMQNNFISSQSVTITATSEETKQVNGWAIFGIVVGVIAFAAACVVTCGAAAAAGAAIGAAAGTAATLAAIGSAVATYGGIIVGGVIVGTAAAATVVYSGDKFIDDLKGEYKLPTIVYTPYTIFSNKIPLFDINFFNPMQAVDEEGKNVEETILASVNGVDEENVIELLNQMNQWCIENIDKEYYKQSYFGAVTIEFDKYFGENMSMAIGSYLGHMNDSHLDQKMSEEWALEIIMNWFENHSSGGIVEIATIGMLGIFNENKVILSLEKDFTGNIEVKINIDYGIRTTTYVSSAQVIRRAVSGIYKTLRIVAIAALLSILVYIGIRIVLTSISKEKAKYKNMLIDWLISLVLIFVLHYLMAFVITVTANLTQLIEGSSIENVMLQIPNGTRVSDSKGNLERLDEGDEGSDFWATNFIGFIRFYAGLVQKKGFTVKGVAYTIMYVVIVIYMIIFTFQYLKRVLYMAFLTMISPLVAITYPLDKLNDGKAQGFAMWLREYIFNALLQPIHCLIYVVIMGSCMQLVINYPLYALVALGFMVPAEKFIRKLFGFEKASTVGNFGAMAGTAALMSGIQKLSHSLRGNKNHNGRSEGNEKANNANRGIKKINSIPTLNDIDGENNNYSKLNKNEVTTKNMSQDMLDSYDEKFGTQDWDYQYRDSLAVDTEKNPEYMYNDDEFDTPEKVLAWKAKNEGVSVEELKEAYGEDGINELLGTFGLTKPPVPSENVELDNKNKPKNKINLKQGVQALAGHYGRRLNNGMKKIHPIRALGRGIAFGAGAATLGTIGLAAGIASGDPSKALQYTLTGGAVGGNLGKNIGSTAANAIGIENGIKAFKSGAIGQSYTQREMEKYTNDFKDNVENYDYALRRVNINGWKEMSKSGGIIDSSIDYGITDIGTMCNIYKTKKELMTRGMEEEAAERAAFKAYKLNEEFGDYSSNSKTQENLNKILTSKGYSDRIKLKTREEILDLIEIYKKASLDFI